MPVEAREGRRPRYLAALKADSKRSSADRVISGRLGSVQDLYSTTDCIDSTCVRKVTGSVGPPYDQSLASSGDADGLLICSACYHVAYGRSRGKKRVTSKA